MASITEEMVAKRQVVQMLVAKFGTSREGFHGVELETKIELHTLESDEVQFPACEKIEFPAPYIRDQTTESSDVPAELYGLRTGPDHTTFKHFCSLVSLERNYKVKIKRDRQIAIYQGVPVLSGKETNHYFEMYPQAFEDVQEIGKAAAKKNGGFFGLAGEVMRHNQETFAFNPVTGRVFVVEHHNCKNRTMIVGQAIDLYAPDLDQLEIEYHSTIKGFTPEMSVQDDLACLTLGLLENLPAAGYSGTLTTMTKFEWLVRRALKGQDSPRFI